MILKRTMLSKVHERRNPSKSIHLLKYNHSSLRSISYSIKRPLRGVKPIGFKWNLKLRYSAYKGLLDNDINIDAYSWFLLLCQYFCKNMDTQEYTISIVDDQNTFRCSWLTNDYNLSANFNTTWRALHPHKTFVL